MWQSRTLERSLAGMNYGDAPSPLGLSGATHTHVPFLPWPPVQAALHPATLSHTALAHAFRGPR